VSSKIQNVLIKRDRTSFGPDFTSLSSWLCFVLALVRVMLEGLVELCVRCIAEHCHPLLALCYRPFLHDFHPCLVSYGCQQHSTTRPPVHNQPTTHSTTRPPIHKPLHPFHHKTSHTQTDHPIHHETSRTQTNPHTDPLTDMYPPPSQKYVMHS